MESFEVQSYDGASNEGKDRYSMTMRRGHLHSIKSYKGRGNVATSILLLGSFTGFNNLTQLFDVT